MTIASVNVDIVRQAYAALKTRELHTILQLSVPDFEIEQSTEVPWGGHYRGLTGLQQFIVRSTQHIDAVMTPEQLIGAGGDVVAIGRSRGVTRASGRSFDVAAVHVWTLRDGKLARFQAYIDHAPMLDALGARYAPVATVQ